ncbi:hypothetical protein SAMN05421659_1368 [[Clostridium] fimetarium]|uniref:Uncharacterized protein n=1 Tax=[Clostridium] fimetarium TaxID=99656 RepID=A0A1I0RYA1_9FIRM|nr:hypothetical protein SAMN05421659_1368 [[Clostridium] fimetarium]
MDDSMYEELPTTNPKNKRIKCIMSGIEIREVILW